MGSLSSFFTERQHILDLRDRVASFDVYSNPQHMDLNPPTLDYTPSPEQWSFMLLQMDAMNNLSHLNKELHRLAFDCHDAAGVCPGGKNHGAGVSLVSTVDGTNAALRRKRTLSDGKDGALGIVCRTRRVLLLSECRNSLSGGRTFQSHVRFLLHQLASLFPKPTSGGVHSSPFPPTIN